MLTQDELFRRARAKWGSDPAQWRYRRRMPRVEALINTLAADGCPPEALKAAMQRSALDSTREPEPGGWSVAGLCLLLSLDLDLEWAEISEVMEAVENMRTGRN